MIRKCQKGINKGRCWGPVTSEQGAQELPFGDSDSWRGASRAAGFWEAAKCGGVGTRWQAEHPCHRLAAKALTAGGVQGLGRHCGLRACDRGRRGDSPALPGAAGVE